MTTKDVFEAHWNDGSIELIKDFNLDKIILDKRLLVN